MVTDWQLNMNCSKRLRDTLY